LADQLQVREVHDYEQRKPATVRELRKQYGDFKIIQPQNEETFWGTANTVTVSWGSSQPLLPDMSVLLYVNGEAREAPAVGGVTLTLDRGEHQVYAVLRNSGKKRIVTTETVTFFIKQHSANFNRPAAGPRN
jgi:hypothetical protein